MPLFGRFRWQPTSRPSALDYGPMAASSWKPAPAPAFQASSGSRQRSPGRKVAGGVIGAVGGFFGGGLIGAAIEGDSCHCDDPGLQGFVIGAAVGAVIGGVVGALFF